MTATKPIYLTTIQTTQNYPEHKFVKNLKTGLWDMKTWNPSEEPGKTFGFGGNYTKTGLTDKQVMDIVKDSDFYFFWDVSDAEKVATVEKLSGSGKIHVEFFEECASELWEEFDPEEDEDLTGWFYHYCLPGCMPDSYPFGPFDSELEAKINLYDDHDVTEAYGLEYCHPYLPQLKEVPGGWEFQSKALDDMNYPYKASKPFRTKIEALLSGFALVPTV